MPDDSQAPFMFRAVQQDPIVFNDPNHPSMRGSLADMAYNAITPAVMKHLGVNLTPAVNPAAGVPYFDRWYARHITTPVYNYSKDLALNTAIPGHVDRLLQSLINTKLIGTQHAEALRDKLVAMATSAPGKMLMQQLPSVQQEMNIHDILFKNRHNFEPGPLEPKYAAVKKKTEPLYGKTPRAPQTVPPPPWIQPPPQQQGQPPPPTQSPQQGQPMKTAEIIANQVFNKLAQEQEDDLTFSGMGRGALRGGLAGGILGGGVAGYRSLQHPSALSGFMSEKDKLKLLLASVLAGTAVGSLGGAATGAMLRPALPKSEHRESLAGSMGRGAMRGLIPGSIVGGTTGGLAAGIAHRRDGDIKKILESVLQGVAVGGASGGIAGATLGAATRPMVT